MSVCSGSTMRLLSFCASGESKRHSSTFVACDENSAKFTPTPVQLAPRGYGSPGHTRMTLKKFKGYATGWGLGTGGWGLGFWFEAINEIDDRGSVQLAEAVRHARGNDDDVFRPDVF